MKDVMESLMNHVTDRTALPALMSEELQTWQDRSNEVMSRYHADIMHVDVGLDQLADSYKYSA